MPRTVTDIDVLQDYLGGVMDRAEHHAGNRRYCNLAQRWRHSGLRARRSNDQCPLDSYQWPALRFIVQS